MVFNTYFLVGDRPLGIIVDLLCLIKLLLCLVYLHTSRFHSSLALYLVAAARICSSYMFSQCMNQNLQLYCSFTLIISYPTHYFTFGRVFCMCASYRVGRLVLQDGEKYSLSLFLIERKCVLCKLLYESSSRYV